MSDILYDSGVLSDVDIREFWGKGIEIDTYQKGDWAFDLDKQLQPKRKMLLDIEKENIMTIASALRVIPKKPENDSAKETILKVLNGNS